MMECNFSSCSVESDMFSSTSSGREAFSGAVRTPCLPQAPQVLWRMFCKQLAQRKSPHDTTAPPSRPLKCLKHCPQTMKNKRDMVNERWMCGGLSPLLSAATDKSILKGHIATLTHTFSKVQAAKTCNLLIPPTSCVCSLVGTPPS